MAGSWAYGTTLERAGNPIAELTNITGPTESADALDVTTHDSPSGFREFVGGLRDAGEISIEGNFDEGDALGQIAMHADLASGTVRQYIMTFPAAMAATLTIDGLVTAFASGAPHDDKVPFSATIKLTGVPVLGITASNNITVLAGIEETLGAALDFIPDFAAATYEYSLDGFDTASTYLQITATFAAGIGTVEALGVEQNILTTVQSGQIVIGAADTMTDVTITIRQANMVATVYVIHVPRP
ncbi:MAG: phage tail tube protein [Dehalococcoidia bacterium]